MEAAARVERWVAWALMAGLAVVLAVTGVVLRRYYAPVGEFTYEDAHRLAREVPVGMVTRNLHRLATWSLVVAAAAHALFVVVTRPSLRWRWLTGGLLAAALALLVASGRYAPFDAIAALAAGSGTDGARAAPLLGREGPFAGPAGTDGRYDARAMLGGGEQVARAAAARRFFAVHGVAAPLFALAAAGAHVALRRARRG